ncbi:hypothetical protein, partial [Roseinatronobacter sp.]|uniref:hypothetical protein n=1 Tax=Roseinatronobacter sp. TaxID=1945755 RepID=UPI0026000F67
CRKAGFDVIGQWQACQGTKCHCKRMHRHPGKVNSRNCFCKREKPRQDISVFMIRGPDGCGIGKFLLARIGQFILPPLQREERLVEMNTSLRNFVARQMCFSLDASHPNRVDIGTKVQQPEEQE